MSDKVRFLMSFRARLILLLASFLLLTIALVILLDNWAAKRANVEIDRQNQQVTAAVNDLIGDFYQAVNLAQQNLDNEEYLYQTIKPDQMPQAIEHILVADSEGKVKDSTLREMINQYIAVPNEVVAKESPGDPVEGEVNIHGGLTKTYDLPLVTTKGLHWIVIVLSQQATINQIKAASQKLSDKNKELSNYRLVATSGLLLLAIAIVVLIGWRFTRPIQELAAAARLVAAGNLDFRVPVKRNDEVGQLAATFNEMISGLKSKRELEERLNQSERAAVIGRLTQSVAHEIRNPLNVINLSIDHVSKRYAPEDSARRERFTQLLSSIKDEIERLKRLVNDLLNYGRPARFAIETVDMRQLVEETLSLLRQQADMQGVSVTIDEASGPASVRGDRERLKSFISNLAINALQAMPTGGHLTARVARHDGEVEVKITDTGVGISEESLGKIFEPYFSTKQSGFGLGLAVTRKIIEEHQGRIAVDSQVDRGTTFTVTLPAAEESDK
ncbi:MAG TPA: ATP-binding protein [Blastocatellia bacterium]|nr:ATP-binding protein [Blastocatellia bacterium]